MRTYLPTPPVSPNLPTSDNNITVSLSANIASLIGSITPRTADLCLYRVKVSVLAEGLQKLAVEDGGQLGGSLLHPDLPVYWYWGMSGICDTYATRSETRCRRRFPPTDDLLSIVEASVRDGSGGDPSGVVSAWKATLDSLNPSRLADKRSKFVSLTKASAALLVLAAILDVLSPLVGFIVLGDNESHIVPYVLPFLAAVFAVIAGALATCAMNEGVHGVVRTGEHGGPGIIMVFVGAALRLGSSTLGCVFCSGVERKKDDKEKEDKKKPDLEKIGFEGEKHMYRTPCSTLPQRPLTPPRILITNPPTNRNAYFAKRIHTWDPNTNWTSDSRKGPRIEPFTRRAEDFADLTYYGDPNGEMREVLRAAGVPVDPAWSDRTHFHIEVKATLGNGRADMYLRASQLEKVRQSPG